MLHTLTRRTFLISGTAASVAFASRAAFGTPLGLPLGIQLYSVRQQMTEDFDGTLAAVRAAGYTEVEAAALPKRPAKEIRASLDKAGLRCVSAHHPFTDLSGQIDERLAFDKELGAKFIICASPGYRNPSPSTPGTAPRAFTQDDWKYNADQFNMMGAKAEAAGLAFGYHNHTREFAATNGVTPYEELLRLTDPKKVTFELDCGWAMVAGVSPIELMKAHPKRFSMLHVKDFRLPATPSPENHDAKVTELGRGSIDYRPIFAQAAKNQNIRHAFVEQEAFDLPWKESLKIDADYIRGLHV